jgi:hypothetical protein
MTTKNPKLPVPGDYRLRCRVCEGWLSMPQKTKAERYNIVENKHGAVVRKCMNDNCNQFWLGYVQELPNGGIRMTLKMIDKPL